MQHCQHDPMALPPFAAEMAPETSVLASLLLHRHDRKLHPVPLHQLPRPNQHQDTAITLRTSAATIAPKNVKTGSSRWRGYGINL